MSFKVNDRVKIFHEIIVDDWFRTEIETTGYITDIKYLANTRDWDIKLRFTVKSDKYSDMEWSFDGIEDMVHYSIEQERDEKINELLNDKH